MKINIAENIKKQRKLRRLTQEQLAEAMSVTVGAVSKWESGQSVPDITLIVELADFFEISVDVLLGYRLEKGSLQATLKKIDELRRKRQLAEAVKICESALVKYPDSFELVHDSASIMRLSGVQTDERAFYERAIGLYERALFLLPQNTDPDIDEFGIKQNIASLYMSIKKYDEAVKMLKEINYGGTCEALIGFTYASGLKAPDEAFVHLSNAMIETTFSDIVLIFNGFAMSYEIKGQYDKAIESLEWLAAFLESLKEDGRITVLDRVEAMILIGIARYQNKLGRDEETEKTLKKAAGIAVAFDSAPVFTLEGVKFYSGTGKEVVYDNMGSSLVDGLENKIMTETDNNEDIKAMWRKMVKECYDG